MLAIERHKGFANWYKRLRDDQGKKLILAKIRQVQVHGEFIGDCSYVGDGVTEMRIHYGPGYRLYAAIENQTLLLLLAGGDKSTQERDIRHARQVFRERKNG